MSIEVSKINKNNQLTDAYQNRVFLSNANVDNIEIFKPAIQKEKNDLSNNGKFDFSVAAENLWSGIKKPFNEVIDYAKESPAQALILGGSLIALAAISRNSSIGRLALNILSGYFIGKPLIEGTSKVVKAKNGDDVEKAFIDFGESTTYTALTFLPSAMDKIKSLSDIRKDIELLHTGGKNVIAMWSNATDVSSFGPKVQNFNF